MKQKYLIHFPSKNILYVGIFAIAMAYIESAVVVYLRRIFGITELTTSLSTLDSSISRIEAGRELATLVMLFALGWVAGRKFQSRAGYLVFAFGLWDIFYYVWLKVFINWPATLFDTDLLFMIPLPWWGPVLSPVLLAILMAAAGVWAVVLDAKGITIRFSVFDLILLAVGLLVDLYVFMADALSIFPCNAATLAAMKPTAFNWPVFLIGFSLIVFSLIRAVFTRRANPQ